VIQIAWLTSDKERLRKSKTGHLSRFLKSIFGGVKRMPPAGSKAHSPDQS
jgi:hypothetical protein